MSSIQWKTLESSTQLEEAIKRSHEIPVALFKHSTRCSVSFMAKKTLELSWQFDTNEIEIYFLDLIRYRELSNKIAESLGVQHESPQLILLQNGEVVYHASHSDISVDALQTKLHS